MKLNMNSRPLFQRSLALQLGLTVGIGLLLVGYGKHYWNKPGAAASDFDRDSADWAAKTPCR